MTDKGTHVKQYFKTQGCTIALTFFFPPQWKGTEKCQYIAAKSSCTTCTYLWLGSARQKSPCPRQLFPLLGSLGCACFAFTSLSPLFSNLWRLGLPAAGKQTLLSFWWQHNYFCFGFGFFKIMKCICLWLEESQKHYKAFNHANSDHFLLTAWHLFKVIMLDRLSQRSYSGLLQKGNAIQI